MHGPGPAPACFGPLRAAFPRSLGLVGSAQAAEPSGLTFLQISDSHVGFDKPANPNALGTLEEGINKIKTMPIRPSFMIHTGDISHLSKVSEFDDAERIISQAKLDVHYVPGEHDFLDEDVKLYRDRYGRGTVGEGYYSFDANGVHFIGLVNVVNLKAGGSRQPRRRTACLARAGSARAIEVNADRRVSRISPCGPSTHNGAGAPKIARRRWTR